MTSKIIGRGHRLMLVPAVAVWLAACASHSAQPVAAPAAPDALHPVAERISDQAIAADLSYIGSLQQRLKALNEAGRPVDDYQFCKAQAWTDLGYEEYTNNDRSGVVEGALEQATFLIQRMEVQDPDIPTDTPVIRESQRLREDLWRFAAETKAGGMAQKTCPAACDLARMEVETVWAGHHERQLGWRYAESEIHAAERYQKQVVAESADCAVPAPAAPAALATANALGVPSVVHFAFDKALIANVTQGVLARAGQALRDNPAARLILTGYADIRGAEGYNQRLGERRAEAVRAYLVAAGVDASRIDVRSGGEVRAVDRDPRHAFAVARRVDLQYVGLDGPEREAQMLDLQADR